MPTERSAPFGWCIALHNEDGTVREWGPRLERLALEHWAAVSAPDLEAMRQLLRVTLVRPTAAESKAWLQRVPRLEGLVEHERVGAYFRFWLTGLGRAVLDVERALRANEGGRDG